MNSPVAISYLMRNPYVLMKKWLGFLTGRKKVNPHLSVYFSPFSFPFERQSRWINLINQYILFLYIKIFVKPKGSLILWINDPYKYLMIKLLKPRIAIYDCPDAIVFSDRKRQRFYDQLRKRVLQESAISFFTSKALLESGRKYSRNCFLVPNGVDIKNFAKARYEIPEDIEGISGTILGVVGTFDDRVDGELIQYVLESVQDATLLLVGPLQKRMVDWVRHPRIVTMGKKPYEELPSFIKRFDVALIPYRINEVTKAVYPVKLHEYLILGKPVVSTDLPEVRQFGDVVSIARSKEEFVSEILKALKMNGEHEEKKRIEVARNNSWEKRVSEISRVIERHVGQQKN
jgi:glycosyltransferase involved in cell wall biosynthesis